MKNFIFVAGVDYEFKGVNFREFCDNRVKYMLSINKFKEDLTFQIFDIRAGEVLTQETTYPSGKGTHKITKRTPAFKPVIKRNYERSLADDGNMHYYFKDGQTDAFSMISILDIYRAVQEIGIKSPKTLSELSFFSHAYSGGPILVNSTDDKQFPLLQSSTGTLHLPVPGTLRDPFDLDPRSEKDFVAPIMTSTRLKNFQNAFHDGGHIWIWGCNFPTIIFKILAKIFKNPKYKDAGVDDEEVFKFTTFTRDEADMLEDWLMADRLITPFPDKRNIEIKFKFLKYFYCLNLAGTYSAAIAEKSQVNTNAGLVGTYSEYDKGVPLRLMHVFTGRGLHRILKFYQNYLGITLEREGRNYGIYTPTTACCPMPTTP